MEMVSRGPIYYILRQHPLACKNACRAFHELRVEFKNINRYLIKIKLINYKIRNKLNTGKKRKEIIINYNQKLNLNLKC